MLKKSRIIAVLSVCVMMFAVVQPAFAERFCRRFYRRYRIESCGQSSDAR